MRVNVHGGMTNCALSSYHLDLNRKKKDGHEPIPRGASEFEYSSGRVRVPGLAPRPVLGGALSRRRIVPMLIRTPKDMIFRLDNYMGEL